MSLWSRFQNVFRNNRLTAELNEELESHIAEAVDRGRDPDDASRAFGSILQRREESRDLKLIPWLDSLRADAVFGWRQLIKRKVTSAAAVLSLALAIGACTSAFRIIDALLLRPLPVSDPDQLYALSWEGVGPRGDPSDFDSCSYPLFRAMRAAVNNQAELIAVSYSERTDLTYSSDQEMEKANTQYVSGWMFSSLGLRPALGRFLTQSDDLKPGASPYAVLSYEYWTRRFGRDPSVLGRKFRMGNDLYQIVGVGPRAFTGTEPGKVTGIFVPTMMQTRSIDNANAFWFRTLLRPRTGYAIEPLRQKLDALYRAYEQERAKTFVNFPKSFLANYPQVHLSIKPAGAGVSDMQSEYRRALIALAVLVALVLLIACANVANLMTAQAAARTRELALRVSIGAARWRLVQLVLVESVLLTLLATAAGAAIAWWSAPFVVSRINPPDDPARLILSFDWRLLAFALVLTLTVTLLFGLAPALRAAAVQPASALKGGDSPHSRRRLMLGLIAVQAAFCFLVLFVSGLFVATFDRLSHQPMGFSADRILILDTVAREGQMSAYWDQTARHLRTLPGVETTALAAWPLMSGTMSNNFVFVNGAPASNVLAFFLAVSPGWLDAMKIPLLDGRDFRDAEMHPGPAIVNRTFARQYFDGADPVGKSFETMDGAGTRTRFEIVGLTADARYRDLKEAMLPVVYVPFQSEKPKRGAAIIVRTSSGNPLSLASMLRAEVPKARPQFRVSNIRTQQEINDSHTIRERLLALLAMFFAGVALLLAGIGLYGVLDYSVLQRHREIGIRMAIGARPSGIARLVTGEAFAMVLIGAVGGLALGVASVRSIQSLIFDVKATGFVALAVPAAAIFGAAMLAALPALVRAVRIDPAVTLRAE